ncbi:myb-like dna-binding domain protein [Colletotrichum kahawae]|uniref:Myb-like dna-binding domain protein n=1 Tax=Colletotrichum kahawae TaxID=34407 RepID=A0AAE0D2S6_COLKA|nr:myb-like dna-binding domain protein [Colletotrichum kahawae]
MEPPAKRPRTGPSPLGQQQNDEDDELNYEPEEVSQMRDPGYQLEQSRNFAAFKLKSTFEHIFAKYEKDFTGIGDEIDLKTGKVVINNGHLENMRHERDMGVPDEEEEEDEGMLLEEAFGSDDEEEDDEEHGAETAGQPDEEEEERILHGKKGGSTSTALIRRSSTEIQRRPSLSSIGGLGSEQRLSSLVALRRPGSSNSALSVSVWGADPEPADPTWKVPEIRKPKLGDSLMANMHGSRYRFPVSYQSIWSSRPDTEDEKMTAEPARIDMKMLSRARQESMRVGRPTSMKLLQAFTAQDDDNDDDILGVSIAERAPRAEKKKEPTPAGDEESTAETSDNITEAEQPVVPVEDPATQEAPTKPSPSQTEATSKSKKQNRAKERQRKEKPQVSEAKVQGPNKKLETSAGNHIEPDKAQPAELGVTAEISSDTPNFVTGDEAQRLPKQKLVIELLSKTPPPGEITEVLEPEDADTYVLNEAFDLPKQSESAAPQEAPRVSELQIDPDAILPKTDSGSAAKPSETTEDQPSKAPEPPKEKFVRHQIDPFYDFSDDEEGIPTTRVPTRIQKPVLASPIGNATTPVTDDVEYMASTSKVPLNDAETTTANDEKERDGEGLIQTSPTTPLADEPGGMDLDAPQPETPKAPAETPEALPDAGEQSSPRESTEDPFTMEQRSIAEPDEEDTVLQDAETKALEVVYTAEASSSPANSPLALPEDVHLTDSQNNQEEGFSVPLLDDVGAESATEPEAEPEPESVDIELPTLPFPTHNTASSPPCSKRGRPKKSNEVPENDATSPMRTLNLDSSSPPKRRASNALKPRKSVKFNEKPSSPAATTHHHDEQPSLPAAPSSSTIKASPRTPSARRSFISLLSDDEDELTLDLFKSWTKTSGGSAPGSSGRKKTSYAPVLLAGPQTKITTPMKQRSHNVGSGGMDKGKKRKAAWAFAVTPTKVQFGSPSGSLVKTPGGHMRRCGEDGFKCDRDFCFTCL